VVLPLRCVARVTHGSLKLCSAVTEVNRVCCVTCLVSFVLPAGDCVLSKQNSVFVEVVFCFCWWNFVGELEPSRHFLLQMYSDVRDGFIGPS